MVVHPVIPALRRVSQEDQEFKTSLGHMVRPYFKEEKCPTKTGQVLSDHLRILK
jgi:hypothetical protein